MNYVLPNEVHVHWTMMIVLYPYVTGLVVGAFVVSALYYVFGVRSLERVARFALACSFVFLLFAPLPLLVHLGRPERAFNIMVTPNFTSVMSGFGYLYSAFLLLVALEIWFVMRSDFIRRAQGTGFPAWLSRLIVLFDLRESEATRRADRRIARMLSAIGIPLSCVLTGYVGFLFGSVKANPWWSTSMMFVIFVGSALVSGTAVLIFHYFVVSWINRWPIDQRCVRTLSRLLWGFAIIAVSLELLEIGSVAYQKTGEWHLISTLITEKLFWSYIVLQFLVFSLVPLVLLTADMLLPLRTRVANAVAWGAAVLLLGQVLMMRWNVVVGGQLISKSGRGFTHYFPKWFEKEGLLTAIVIFSVPFVILYLFHRLIPLFPGVAAARAKKTVSSV